MNVILVGFMGAGKSAVGVALARHLGYAFLDTDAVLAAQAGKSIAAIFEEDGEPCFRRLERAWIDEQLPRLQRTVVASGGGMGALEEQMTLLKRAGWVVFLRVPFAVLRERWRATRSERAASGLSSRPLLRGAAAGELERLWRQRLPVYQQAHAVVDNDSLEGALGDTAGGRAVADRDEGVSYTVRRIAEGLRAPCVAAAGDRYAPGAPSA